MPRAKDTKTIAKRIDLQYFKKPHPWRSTRLALVVLAVLAAGGWVGYAVSTNNQSIYNPGPVTSAHSSFQNNCAECHDSDAKGGFVKAVSDAACMKCHEAPMHHPNQLVREGNAANNPLALAANIPLKDLLKSPLAKPAPVEEGAAQAAASPEQPAGAAAAPPMEEAKVLVSANCTSCHVEHRGHAALAAVSDTHCTQCHSDLSKAVKDIGKRQVPEHVVEFSESSHPHFGRQLRTGPANAWVDPTRLRFNHAKHFEESVVQGKLANNCTLCHESSDVSAGSVRPRTEGLPPFGPRKESSWQWLSSGDSAFMQPVNFERHCQGCHSLDMPSGVPVAHKDMSIVRGQLRDLELTHFAYLSTLSPDRRTQLIGTANPASWVKESVEKIDKAVGSWARSTGRNPPDAMKDQYATLQEILPKEATSPPLRNAPPSDPNVLELFMAYGAGTACVKCHDLQGVVPAVYSFKATGMKPQRARPALASPGESPAESPAPSSGGSRLRRPGGGGGTSEATPAETPAPASTSRLRRPGGGSAAAAPTESASAPATEAPATQEAPAETSPPAPTEDVPKPTSRLRRPGSHSDARQAFPSERDQLALADALFVPDGHPAQLQNLLASRPERSPVLLAQLRRPGSRKPEAPPAEAPAEAPAPSAPATETPTAPVTETPAASPGAETAVQTPSATPTPASYPSDLTLLSTVPTGIPDVPRRWFANARFNHQSHRAINCLDCHAAAQTSTLTTDVLSPDLITKGAASGKSCIDCHGTKTPGVAAALSACVTCHDYHDHTREFWPTGKTTPLASAPVPAAAKAEEPATSAPATGG